MNRAKPTTAKTPEALARALGLSGNEEQEWQVHYALLKRLRQAVDDEGPQRLEESGAWLAAC